jgi:hypothetical protein
MSESGAEQRRSRLIRRWQPRRQARVACHRGMSDLRPDVALALLDLSESGARLVSREALPPGQRVYLMLEGPGSGRVSRRQGVVAWSVPAADGTHCVGVKLLRRLGSEELRDLAWC